MTGATEPEPESESDPGMVARVNYRREGAGDLLRYIERGARRPLRNSAGRAISAEEREAFLRRSRDRGFTRSVVLSVPDHVEATPRLDDREIGRATRRVMNEQLRDAPGARYVYGIHEDTDHRHAHIALTGSERELTWDREDLDQLRERADERFIERHREIGRPLDRDRHRGQERAVERDRGRARER